MILDTDVLIWFFRGNEKAKTAIDKALPFSISSVTFMELLQGVKNKAEQMAIKKQLRTWNVNVIHLNEAISIRSIQFVSDFSLSHSMAAMDALIAGTVVEYDGKLLTGNSKHFEYVPGIELYKFLPA
ncbi:ribonuclease VapC [Clostridia bacterium]|nr:ribonuclease VapC [Clostridia bacterium]